MEGVSRQGLMGQYVLERLIRIDDAAQGVRLFLHVSLRGRKTYRRQVIRADYASSSIYLKLKSEPEPVEGFIEQGSIGVTTRINKVHTYSC